ncbi:kelch-like protein 10 [Notolabrus celidotus]|uniref:kelch-like protein 10 n=1 Tax=Notolabrus celidotus TaxID=1203425 RepID=UPI0014902FDB|nr:kelch-like protein 10 [Notolabrus celidotus]
MSENTLNGSSVYNELRLEQELCDAVIRVDGVEIHVHKIILCNCSPYFRSLFTHWSTPHCRVFYIPNVSLDMMKFIVEFAYTGCVSVAQENIRELFIAADQFNVQGIIQACSEYLENQLVPQNCIGIWSFSDVYYTRELKHKAYAFLLSHFEEVASSSAEFLQLPAQELVKLLENDHLNVKKEKKVFEAIIHWINHAPEERSGYITLLLSCVRLALIIPQYILETVAKNELVEASEECRAIVLTALDTVIDLRTRGLPDLIPLHPMARPRLPSAFLLAFGGWSGGAPTSSFASYDNRAECWVSITDDEAEPRAYHGTAFLNGSLYCVGGFNGVVQFSTMKRFDLTTHTWQEVAPMHSKRCYVSVTVLDGQIYALGGYDGHHRLDTAERYEPSTNQWTLIAPMHHSRSDASCTTLHVKVYICGGFNGTDCLSSAECYNPKTDQWTLIAPMGSSRSGVGVIAYANHVFAVGGFNGISRLQTAEFYNPLTNTWHDVPSMLNPRSNFGIEVIEDHIFVAGGFNGFSTTADVECYDFDTGEWSDVSDLEISCSALSCCVVYGLPNMAEYAAPRHFLQLLDEEPDEVE